MINEINYNSNDDFDSGDWVELFNNSENDIDLSGWKFLDEDDSHVYSFNDSTYIDAGNYLVLCQDTTNFTDLHTQVENYIGDIGFGFSGGGELLRLLDSSGVLVDAVEYDDSTPWPIEPDGNGPTLELINPALDNTIPSNWASSTVQSGSPGSTNSVFSLLKTTSNELLPSVFALHQNYPNPFNPLTTIRYDLPEDSHTVISIFDLMGRNIKTLVNNNQVAGYKAVKWDATNHQGKNISAGVYIYKIKAGQFSKTNKMILLK